MIDLDEIEPLLLRLATCSDAELLRVAEVLAGLDGSLAVTDLLNVKVRIDSPWRQLPVSFLLTQIWYRLGYLDRAMASFEQFLGSRADENEYYAAAQQYLSLKATGYREQEIYWRIAQNAGSETVARMVFRDLSDPSLVFASIKLPQCPDCDGCGLAADCLTRTSLNITDRIYPEMRRSGLE
jgi:hypothetical protein